jgi:hypothetical protein
MGAAYVSRGLHAPHYTSVVRRIVMSSKPEIREAIASLYTNTTNSRYGGMENISLSGYASELTGCLGTDAELIQWFRKNNEWCHPLAVKQWDYKSLKEKWSDIEDAIAYHFVHETELYGKWQDVSLMGKTFRCLATSCPEPMGVRKTVRIRVEL